MDFKNRFCQTIVRANADSQSGSSLLVGPSKMKAGSIFIGRELRMEAQRRNSLFFSIQQSPSRANAGLAEQWPEYQARGQKHGPA